VVNTLCVSDLDASVAMVYLMHVCPALVIAHSERSLEEAQSQAALGGNFAKTKM
jgi:hypothetical protein